MQRTLERLDQVLGVISRWADRIAGVLLILLTIDVFAEVLFRYALSMPIRFSSELAVVLFPWIVFLSAIMITKNDGHIGIVIIRESIKGMRRKILEIFIHVVMIAFSVTMLVAGWNLAIGVSQNILPIMQVSTIVLYITVPLSFAFILMILLVRLARIVIAPPDSIAPPREELEDGGVTTV